MIFNAEQSWGGFMIFNAILTALWSLGIGALLVVWLAW